MKRANVLTAVLALTLAASSSPAHASDFTGMGTFLAAIYGFIFLIVTGGIFGVSYAAGKGPVRSALRWAGLAIGLALTIWWVIDPIAEGYALLIVFGLLFGALIIAIMSRKPASTDNA